MEESRRKDNKVGIVHTDEQTHKSTHEPSCGSGG